ncbi:MAG: type VI secretion system protein TssA [Puniceicoccales bacterium]
MSDLSEHPLSLPIAGDKPTGEDLSYEASYATLEEDMRGQPAQYVGRELQREAREPDWNEVGKTVETMLERSRDLYLFVSLATARLAAKGLTGFSEVLGLIRINLETHGDALYPELDPAEPPVERYISWRNLLQNLADPVYNPEDPFRTIHRLQHCPLTNSQRVGRFTLADIIASDTGEPGAPGSGEIEAAFQDTAPEFLNAEVTAVSDAIEAVTGIEAVTRESMGMENAPNLSPLKQALQGIQERLTKYIPEAAPTIEDVAAGEVSAEGTESAAPARNFASVQDLKINSRDEARTAIEKVIEYYRRYEPASPLPLMLERARRLVDSDFLAILEDLHPESVESLRQITSGKETN